MVRLPAILGLGAVLLPTPAHADQTADTLKRLNLLGRWANDCADPVRRGISYELTADGSAVFVNVVGPHRILSATSVDGREVVLTKTAEPSRSEEHTSELQSRQYLVCRLLLEKKKKP